MDGEGRAQVNGWDRRSSGMANRAVPPTAAKPTGMGGMWMGGTVIGPIPASAPTAGMQREGVATAAARPGRRATGCRC